MGLVIRIALWFLPRWGETKSEGDFTRFVPVMRDVVESLNLTAGHNYHSENSEVARPSEGRGDP